MDLRSDTDSWIVSSTEKCYATDQEHRDHVKQSGFYRQSLAVPNLVQILYLLALAEYRGTGFAKKNVPFASGSMEQLMFARTSTGLSWEDQGDCRLAVAYFPTKAVAVRAVAQSEDENMCSIGAFILR
jgi:hypothetical protein